MHLLLFSPFIPSYVSRKWQYFQYCLLLIVWQRLTGTLASLVREYGNTSCAAGKCRRWKQTILKAGGWTEFLQCAARSLPALFLPQRVATVQRTKINKPLVIVVQYKNYYLWVHTISRDQEIARHSNKHLRVISCVCFASASKTRQLPHASLTGKSLIW